MNTARLLSRYFATSVRAQLQYPASSLLLGTGTFLTTIIELAGIWALFDRFGDVQGWRFGDICMFFGIVSISFAIADFFSRGFDVFGSEFIRTGDFDRVLLRPRTATLQLVGHDFRLRVIGRLMQGIVVLVVGSRALDFQWNAISAGLALWTIAGGVALFFGLMVLQATLAFWTVESLEVVNVVTYGGVQAAQFPLSLYAGWLRSFLIFVVPIACVAYFPVLAILGKPDPLGAPDWFLPLAPTVAFGFLAIAFAAWRLGVRKYTSTGT
ncbi:ABC transporter permease [Burkholderia sp. Bp8963]|uniref:ABC transporter permease n=1 Tax=Burkholderia sp. Bp8963 TaxID=2184547 RepID=UPI000F5A3F40|nr:ABC-2 family transporter protein [Burkholderia sp. Bp8963]RQS71545.1 ABC transporter permease [Burkholderia sp. Bp8963]